jgi:hypothetical protein
VNLIGTRKLSLHRSTPWQALAKLEDRETKVNALEHELRTPPATRDSNRKNFKEPLVGDIERRGCDRGAP